MNLPTVSEDEAYRLVESFNLEASTARRPYVRVAAMGFFFQHEDNLKFGLKKANEIKSRT